MSVTYSPAPQVANIAAKLIAKHHDHLENIEVAYVFRSEHAERHGHVVLGKARKISGLNAFLVKKERLAQLEATIEVNHGVGVPMEEFANDEPFFVVEIAQDIWKVLTASEREALVDHELSHCRTKLNKDLELQLFVAPHDLEEFAAVIGRRGLWRPNLKQFFKAAKAGQPTLWSELEESDDGEDGVIHDMAAARG